MDNAGFTGLESARVQVEEVAGVMRGNMDRCSSSVIINSIIIIIINSVPQL